MSFYPSTVVIGGGLGRREEFFGPVRALVLSRPEHHPTDLSIVAAALGDDAGLAGAAAWTAATGSRHTPIVVLVRHDTGHAQQRDLFLYMVEEAETKLQYNYPRWGVVVDTGPA
jgi:hypothetical protein